MPYSIPCHALSLHNDERRNLAITILPTPFVHVFQRIEQVLILAGWRRCAKNNSFGEFQSGYVSRRKQNILISDERAVSQL